MFTAVFLTLLRNAGFKDLLSLWCHLLTEEKNCSLHVIQISFIDLSARNKNKLEIFFGFVCTGTAD